jgi:hypothetical protein
MKERNEKEKKKERKREESLGSLTLAPKEK